MCTIYAKINYRCNPNHAIWTGASKGCGLISIDLETTSVGWTKLWGCDPYWWQVADAIMSVAPAAMYDRNHRLYPFNVHIREGYTGCEYIHLNLYRKIADGTYVHFKCGAKFNIAMTDKIGDFSMYYGDFVEITRALYEKRGWEFSRNPRSFKQNTWHFIKLHNFDIVSEEEVYDPIAVRAEMERDPDRRDPNHHRSHHRNRSRAFNHG